MRRYRSWSTDAPPVSVPQRFGIRGASQLRRDLAAMVRGVASGTRFGLNLGSAGLLRPDLSLPAYAGRVPVDGIAPIFNFFDRARGGRGFRSTVQRSTDLRDWRGGRLSYDEHDGTDFVCPPGTQLVAAAPGVVVASRDTWTRGGLTLCVDHGDGVVTQYTHLQGMIAELGERVERGQAIAWSGVSGVDMTQFFPWVPPHVHFMVWIDGQPVDPYRAPGETGPGAWLHGNDPRTATGALADDPSPSSIRPEVDRAALARVVEACPDRALRAELEAAPDPLALAAIVEDSLHHDAYVWPEALRGVRVRPRGEPGRVRLTLPLPADTYRGASAGDAPWTRPARATS
ncbi:MAG: M23 family metallopeptidase [Kofleriaceae bacterium]